MGKLYIGTSGYNYKHWKGFFYPDNLKQKDWLPFYSKHFKTVEINATFYGNFKQEVFEKWANEVEPGFTFCLKGPRFITHVKRLKDVKDPLENFFTNAFALGKSFEIVLWQFPKSFKLNKENLERLEVFCSLLTSKVRHAFEFRDISWFNDDIYSLLNKYKCGFVIADSPGFPKKETTTGGFSYIRFHGSSKLYSSNYSDKELKDWAIKIKKLRKRGNVYCYFNNDVSGFAVFNAKRLIGFLP